MQKQLILITNTFNTHLKPAPLPPLPPPPPPHPPKKTKNKCKVLIVFNGMAAAMISSEKLNQIVTELFVKGSQRFYRTILFCSTKGF